MSAHLFVFPTSLPSTYESWQQSVDKLGLPATLLKSGVIGSGENLSTTVRFASQADYVECYERDFEDFNKILSDLLAPALSTRSISLDFIYSSKGLAAALVLTAGLMIDYEALCYMDWQSRGFMSIEEVLSMLEEIMTIQRLG
jgi:hypothetical protein